jgi:hypothetical protein
MPQISSARIHLVLSLSLSNDRSITLVGRLPIPHPSLRTLGNASYTGRMDQQVMPDGSVEAPGTKHEFE